MLYMTPMPSMTGRCWYVANLYSDGLRTNLVEHLTYLLSAGTCPHVDGEHPRGYCIGKAAAKRCCFTTYAQCFPFSVTFLMRCLYSEFEWSYLPIHLLPHVDGRSYSNGTYTLSTYTVYNDLTHPASTFVSKKYAWRSADGSFNNPNLPDLGKSHTPYARSVQQVHPLPPHMLPDSGLVFDTLLKRDKVIFQLDF